MIEWKFYSFTEEQLLNAIDISLSKREVLLTLGLQGSGGNYDTLNSLIEKLNIKKEWKRAPPPKNRSSKRAFGEILIENGPKIGIHMRKRLFDGGILKKECSSCGLGSVWNKLPISLQIDHINGKNRDNRIENLRILCPNCHSQTSTFGSRNLKKVKEKKVKTPYIRPKKEPLVFVCPRCSRTRKHSSLCASCFPKNHKIKWPPLEWVLEQLKRIPKTQLAAELGVSDVAVGKYIRRQQFLLGNKK